MISQQDKDAINKIDGWLSEEEAVMLADYAKEVNGHVLEIGSFKGRSTVALAIGMSYNPHPHKVYACDHFKGSPEHGDIDTYPEFVVNTMPYREYIEVITAKSTDAIDEIQSRTYSLVFIDGEHSRSAVEADFEIASKVMNPRGIIVFHDAAMHQLAPKDTPWPEVALFVNELIRNGRVQFLARADRCIAVCLTPKQL